jgi:ABC-type dipeptide/oligopeptide/nickel transport system permease subunit
MGIFPTVTIALAMLSFNFMGDGLRDALDPTMYNQ